MCVLRCKVTDRMFVLKYRQYIKLASRTSLSPSLLPPSLPLLAFHGVLSNFLSLSLSLALSTSPTLPFWSSLPRKSNFLYISLLSYGLCTYISHLSLSFCLPDPFHSSLSLSLSLSLPLPLYPISSIKFITSPQSL